MLGIMVSYFPGVPVTTSYVLFEIHCNLPILLHVLPLICLVWLLKDKDDNPLAWILERKGHCLGQVRGWLVRREKQQINQTTPLSLLLETRVPAEE